MSKMQPKGKLVKTPYGTGKIPNGTDNLIGGKFIVKMDAGSSVVLARGNAALIDKDKIEVTGFYY